MNENPFIAFLKKFSPLTHAITGVLGTVAGLYVTNTGFRSGINSLLHISPTADAVVLGLVMAWLNHRNPSSTLGANTLKSIAIISLCLLSISAAAQTPTPTPKAKKTGIQKVAKVASFPFAHPISTIRGILTPPLLAVDAGADVAHKGFVAADVATGVGSGKVFGIIHGFFHVGNVASGKVDNGADWLEKTLAIPLDSDD